MNNNVKFNYPSSEKVYLHGSIYPDLCVGMRRVQLTPTISFEHGERKEEANAPVYIYDTSGAYSDPNVEIDLERRACLSCANPGSTPARRAKHSSTSQRRASSPRRWSMWRYART